MLIIPSRQSRGCVCVTGISCSTSCCCLHHTQSHTRRHIHTHTHQPPAKEGVMRSLLRTPVADEGYFPATQLHNIAPALQPTSRRGHFEGGCKRRNTNTRGHTVTQTHTHTHMWENRCSCRIHKGRSAVHVRSYTQTGFTRAHTHTNTHCV